MARGLVPPLVPRRVAREHCATLLTSLGWDAAGVRDAPESHPDLVWAGSGAMGLTGSPSAPPLLAPAPLASCARGAMLALDAVAGDAAPSRAIDGATLLGERAAHVPARRGGMISATGGCRLLRARDGWLAVNLARPSDVASLPAWLDVLPSGEEGGAAVAPSTWAALARALASQPTAGALDRARLLGMPVAPVPPPPASRSPWFRRVVEGSPRRPSPVAAPLVVDLSTLWAGPLAASLLGAAGARVIKVESTRRPDGTRKGPAGFFDLMNAGKESVALDLGSSEGRAALVALLRRADIVIESARPRALQQLGIDAAALVRSVPGLVWVGITGYGRDEPEGGWVAFGDDAAAAAGLAIATGGDAPVFCGDAIADPLTGLHAAVAALATWRSGAACLLDVSLRAVTASLLVEAAACRRAAVVPGTAPDAWDVELKGERQPVAQPSSRRAGSASALGADTARVLEELARDASPSCRA